MTPQPALSRRDLMKTFGAAAAGGALVTGNPAGAAAQDGQNPAASGVEAGGFRFWASPSLQRLRPDHAYLLVTTTEPSAVHVDLREGDRELPRARATVFGQASAGVRRHLVPLTGLSPGKTYRYRVTARHLMRLQAYSATYGETIASEEYSFTTPDPAAEEVHFSVLNDIHQRLDLYDAFMRQVAGERCDFLALNGDMLNDPVDEAQVIDHVFAPLNGAGASLPLEFVRGNHECRGAFSRGFAEVLPTKEGGYYYDFRQGPIHIVVLDTGEDKPDGVDEYFGLAAFEPYYEKQTRWLEGVLASESWRHAPFRVALAHIPVRRVTEGRLWNISREHQHTWMRMLSQAGLDLMLCGHTHRYEVVGPADEPGYPMVIGGGPDPGRATRIAVRADQRRMTATVTDDAGQTLDTLRYDRRA